MDFPDVSSDKTHHVFDGMPIYNKRFKSVREYKFPGIAAVKDDSGAYHIDLFGNPLYPQRYEYAGDFICETAAVKDFSGRYYYIHTDGKQVGFDKYLWASDFNEEDGTAVIYHEKFGAAHITNSCELLYGDYYYDARPFSGGRAKIRDELGWKYVDHSGRIIEICSLPNDNYPRGNVRYLPPENPMPEVISKTDYDSAVVFIRHAEREPFHYGEPGNSKKLTQRGKNEALKLGKSLPKIVKAYSSPMDRCMDTARLISDSKPEASKYLGSPSAYIYDDALSHEYYSKIHVKTAVLEYLKTGTLPGHLEIHEGTEKMSEFLNNLLEKNGVTLCVTHDAFLAIFIAQVTGYDFTDDWVGFLDGCIIFRKGSARSIWWRGELRNF